MTFDDLIPGEWYFHEKYDIFWKYVGVVVYRDIGTQWVSETHGHALLFSNSQKPSPLGNEEFVADSIHLTLAKRAEIYILRGIKLDMP